MRRHKLLDAGPRSHREVIRSAVSTLSLVGSDLAGPHPGSRSGCRNTTIERACRRAGERHRYMQGSIVRIVRDRGFGFIKAENGSEVFFHATGVTGSTPFDNLSEGQTVSYDKEQDSRGRGERAVNVQLA
jgi:cold shock protein